ncbi:MAG: MBL fold metallo-hydrolase, partial [Dehalococcoidia bacterium]|nr:MBL fold metallo-hydrolase [Dehalococcoidia bacterium]
YVGIPFPREELESLGARFNLTTGPVELAPGMWTTGEVSQEVGYEDVDPDMYLKQGEGWVKDPLQDDLALVVKTPRGLVVVPGCAHRGIVNTLHQARRVVGEEPIHAVMGGTHLFRASAERIEQTAADLLSWEIQHLGVCHCTGFRACARLADALGDAFFLNNAGNRWRLKN